MPADVFTGKKNLIFSGEKTAVRGKGNTVKRHSIGKSISHMEDPFRLPFDRSNRNRWMVRGKIIVEDMVSGAAGGSGLHKGSPQGSGLFILGRAEIDFGAFSIFADIDLLDVIDGTDDVLCQKPSKDEFCEMLWKTDKLHCETVIDIDIKQMLIQNLLFCREVLSIPANKLIGFCFQ